MNNLKIAWRNLWRNKRRTLITSSSIFFGVIFSSVMTSMQYGSYDAMINNVVKFYSGYMQIFTEDYHENKTINNTFVLTDSLQKILQATPEITNFTPRLEYFALASSEEITKGTVVVGVDAEKENQVTDLKKWVIRGNYLDEGDNGVLVAVDLANYLKIDVGDTLVLYGQGYHGVMAAGTYPVKGILKFGLPELNKQFVYMDITTCQQLFSADKRITSMVVMVKDNHVLPKAKKDIQSQLKAPLMLQTWDEMQPELVQMIDADKAGGVFTKAILYIIITFGIFGTILMMISERTRELGVMVAIGMQRAKLAVILLIETFLIGLVGAVAGILGSIPIINYYFHNPIELTGDAARTMTDMGIEPFMYFSRDLFVYYNQAITVFIITLVIALYPIYRAFTLKLNLSLKA